MNKSRILLTDKILIGNILIDHQTTWSWDLLWEGPFWHHTICGADLMKRTFCRQTFRRQTLYLITKCLHVSDARACEEDGKGSQTYLTWLQPPSDKKHPEDN